MLLNPKLKIHSWLITYIMLHTFKILFSVSYLIVTKIITTSPKHGFREHNLLWISSMSFGKYLGLWCSLSEHSNSKQTHVYVYGHSAVFAFLMHANTLQFSLWKWKYSFQKYREHHVSNMQFVINLSGGAYHILITFAHTNPYHRAWAWMQPKLNLVLWIYGI